MAAFPQLGYGYKSNTSHIANSETSSPISLAWWRNCLTTKQQITREEKLKKIGIV